MFCNNYAQRCKFTLVTFALSLITFSAHSAEWTQQFDDEGQHGHVSAHSYYDKSYRKVNGARVEVKVMSDYESPTKLSGKENVSSAVWTSTYDCSASRFKANTLTTYTEPMGRGEGQTEKLNNKFSEYPLGIKLNKSFLSFVCGDINVHSTNLNLETGTKASYLKCGDNNLICDKNEGAMRGSCVGALYMAQIATTHFDMELRSKSAKNDDERWKNQQLADKISKLGDWAANFSKRLENGAYEAMPSSQFNDFEVWRNKSTKLSSKLAGSNPQKIVDAIYTCKKAYRQ